MRLCPSHASNIQISSLDRAEKTGAHAKQEPPHDAQRRPAGAAADRTTQVHANSPTTMAERGGTCSYKHAMKGHAHLLRQVRDQRQQAHHQHARATQPAIGKHQKREINIRAEDAKHEKAERNTIHDVPAVHGAHGHIRTYRRHDDTRRSASHEDGNQRSQPSKRPRNEATARHLRSGSGREVRSAREHNVRSHVEHAPQQQPHLHWGA